MLQDHLLWQLLRERDAGTVKVTCAADGRSEPHGEPLEVAKPAAGARARLPVISPTRIVFQSDNVPSTDFHLENVIASDEQPLLIDLETMLQSR